MSLRRFVLLQLAAMVMAMLLLTAADQVIGFFLKPDPGPAAGGSLSRYMFNWGLPEAETLFRQALGSANQIVMFGSSELSSSYGNEPFLFFPQKRGVPLLAIGAGGAQSLTILTLLLQHQDLVQPGARIVVMLSPWWFLNPGTEAGAFRRFTPPSALAKIYFDPAIAPQFKAPLVQFMHDKMYQINPPSLEMLLFRYPWLSPLNGFVHFVRVELPEFVRAHSRIYQARWPSRFEFVAAPTAAAPFDWNAELAARKKENQEHSTSNSFGFADTSWPSYKGTVPRELKNPAPAMTEIHDLEVLAEFLRSRQVKALFFMQPLNRLAYQKMERFEGVQRDVATVLAKNGMKYVDYLTLPFEKEMLVDLAHLSSYGWARANQEIETWRETVK